MSHQQQFYIDGAWVAPVTPKFLDVIDPSNEDAFEMARLCARVEGVPVWISSGAALTAAFDVASREEMAGKLIVTIIPSFAERYLSTPLFEGL